MLCIKQVLALVLFLLLVIVSLYIVPSILKSIEGNKELQKPRKIHNRFLIRVGFGAPPNFNIGDTHSDITIDLEVIYPHATLTVDEPVDISAVATIKPELFPNVTAIAIGFAAGQVYPVAEENGIIKPSGIFLIKSENYKMVGSVKLCWPIEGKYKPTYSLELNNTKTPNSQGVELITVYPKSEVAQIVTNRALIDLAMAAYFLGVASVIKIIIDLLTSQ